MKTATIFLLLGVALFGGQFWYFRSKANSHYERAARDVQNDANRAYEQFKPVFKISNFLTLGHAYRQGEKLFDRMRDLPIQALETSAPNDPGWYNEFRIKLEILQDASKHGFRLTGHQVAMVEALQRAEPKMRSTVGLEAWESMIRAMEASVERGTVPAEAVPGLATWLAEVQKVDRRPFGLREAVWKAERRLREGVEALGLLASVSAEDPLIGVLPNPIGDSQLLAAENAFGWGRAACDLFVGRFKETDYPPELKPLYVKLDFNQAAMKVGHLEQKGVAELSQMTSEYLVGLIVSPNSAEVPTSAEIFGAFMQGMSGQLYHAQQIFESAGGAKAEERPMLRAVMFWTQAQLDLAASGRPNPQLAQSNAMRFRSMREAIASNPSDTVALADLEANQGTCILLK